MTSETPAINPRQHKGGTPPPSTKKGNTMKKAIKKLLDVIAFALGFGGEIRRQTVDDGICDFGGQGRDEYGR